MSEKDLIIENGVVKGYKGNESFTEWDYDRVLEIPEGVTAIAPQAFAHNKSIISVVLPRTLREIGDRAFLHCAVLESINIPSQVEVIPESCFWGCSSLTTVKFEEFDGFEWADNSINSRLITIGEGAFNCCSRLKEFEMPKTVRTLGEGAFQSCYNLRKMVIPEGLKEIPRSAFLECLGLRELILPEGLEAIGEYAFASCTSLKEVAIPKSVRTLGEGAFDADYKDFRAFFNKQSVEDATNADRDVVQAMISRERDELTILTNLQMAELRGEKKALHSKLHELQMIEKALKQFKKKNDEEAIAEFEQTRVDLEKEIEHIKARCVELGGENFENLD